MIWAAKFLSVSALFRCKTINSKMCSYLYNVKDNLMLDTTEESKYVKTQGG